MNTSFMAVRLTACAEALHGSAAQPVAYGTVHITKVKS